MRICIDQVEFTVIANAGAGLNAMDFVAKELPGLPRVNRISSIPSLRRMSSVKIPRLQAR